MEFWYISCSCSFVFNYGVEMKEFVKKGNQLRLYENVVKQAKQEKAQEIFDDLENLWCEKNNGTFTIYGYEELKKKHLDKHT